MQGGPVTVSGRKREAKVRSGAEAPGQPGPCRQVGQIQLPFMFLFFGMEAKQMKERSRKLAAVVEHLAHKATALR